MVTTDVFTRTETRRQSRARMQRAARIYAGTMTVRDKIATYPDKGWALVLLAGVALIAYALGCGSLLLLDAVIS